MSKRKKKSRENEIQMDLVDDIKVETSSRANLLKKNEGKTSLSQRF
jgi:hypothetical protein